jgi:DNA-binding NarL/FixJ family response regulator
MVLTYCLVVEDHPLTLDGTLAALRSVNPHMSLLEAPSLAMALARLTEPPSVDLVLLDLDLPDSQGIDTLKAVVQQLSTQDPLARVVVLSGHCEPELVRQVIENFGTGFIPKALPRALFEHAIALTLAGGVFIPEVVLRQMTAAAPVPCKPEDAAAQRSLTPRETEVAALLIQGLTYKRIAKELERTDGKPMSDHTVRTHVGNIAWKLGVTENAKSGVMAEIARRGLVFPKPAATPQAQVGALAATLANTSFSAV